MNKRDTKNVWRQGEQAMQSSVEGFWEVDLYAPRVEEQRIQNASNSWRLCFIRFCVCPCVWVYVHILGRSWFLWWWILRVKSSIEKKKPQSLLYQSVADALQGVAKDIYCLLESIPSVVGLRDSWIALASAGFCLCCLSSCLRPFVRWYLFPRWR